jgi:hypothetical protein
MGVRHGCEREQQQICGMSYSGKSRDEEIAGAATHLADLAWSHDAMPSDEDEAFARKCLAPYVPKRDLERQVRETLYRWGWHRRYHAARDAGFDDDAARDHASGLRPIAALAA